MNLFEGWIAIQRRELLARARRHWANTTYCASRTMWATADLSSRVGGGERPHRRGGQSGGACATAKFPLSSASGRRRECAEGSWSGSRWRHLRLEDGRLIEELQWPRCNGLRCDERYERKSGGASLVVVRAWVWARSAGAEKRTSAFRVQVPHPPSSLASWTIRPQPGRAEPMDRVGGQLVGPGSGALGRAV